MASVDLTILVYDLSPNITKADLITFFSYCGTIDDIKLHGNGPELRSARVTFKQPYAQQIALLLNNAFIGDCKVRILPEKDSTNKTQAGVLFDDGYDLGNMGSTFTGAIITQDETESSAAEHSLAEILRSVGNAGSACLAGTALWLSGAFDKASKRIAQVAVHTNINKERKVEREVERERTNSREQTPEIASELFSC